MRPTLLLVAAVLAAGCSKPDSTPAADSTATGQEPAATISLADVAGTWAMELGPEGRDTILLRYTMTATADTTGWTVNFEGRDPVPMRIIEVAGDSIVAEAGPYDSALRPGVPVTVRLTSRLRGDALMSRMTARYQTSGADSVVQLRARGRRQ